MIKIKFDSSEAEFYSSAVESIDSVYDTSYFYGISRVSLGTKTSINV